MTAIEPTPFVPDWPAPDCRLLAPTIPPAPDLPLEDCLCAPLASWVRSAGQAKGAPPDNVFSSLLASAASWIGNARWVSPWHGWAEPPVLWVANIGLPSSGKSPALQPVLNMMDARERDLRLSGEADKLAWAEKAEIAKIAETAWRDSVKTALKSGDNPPSMPDGCDPGPEPHTPRLTVRDATIEKLGAIIAHQPRGTLQFRDELAGWLEGMSRYSSGSDRPFWLEAYNGQGFSVERIGRDPVTIDRMAISVLGGIQPDRLRTLLLKADDDGLLARMLPIWPAPAPVQRPQPWENEALLSTVMTRLYDLQMVADEAGNLAPWFVQFSDPARDAMDEFRIAVREWENNADGLLLSFIGKLPGMCARLALVLSYLDWAVGSGPEPAEISAGHFGKAAHLIESYLLPMARRSYASGSIPKAERAALSLVALIRENGLQTFSSRDITRIGRQGLKTAQELNPALNALEDGDCIRPIDNPSGPKGGRPTRSFLVNPAVHKERS